MRRLGGWMKRIRPVWLAVGLLACFSSGAFADVSMQLTSVSGSGIMGGVYTSPYHVSVDGTPMLLICDDFLFEIPSIPYSWTATSATLADLPSRPPRFPRCPDP